MHAPTSLQGLINSDVPWTLWVRHCSRWFLSSSLWKVMNFVLEAVQLLADKLWSHGSLVLCFVQVGSSVLPSVWDVGFLLKHHPSGVLVESKKVTKHLELGGLKFQTLCMQLGSCWNLSSILCPSRCHFQPGSLEAWPIHILCLEPAKDWRECCFIFRFWAFLLLRSSLP